MKKTALAKVQLKKQSIVKIEDAVGIKLADAALMDVANLVTAITKPSEAAFIHTKIKDWSKALEDLGKVTRAVLLSVIQSKGKAATEAGTLRAEVDGWQLEARVRKTGLDDKKVESMLRAKNIPVDRGMVTEIKYKANEAMLQALVSQDVISSDEYELCKADLDYNVGQPKRIQE